MRYGNRALVFYLSGAVLLLALALILTRLPFGSTHTSGPEDSEEAPEMISAGPSPSAPSGSSGSSGPGSTSGSYSEAGDSGFSAPSERYVVSVEVYEDCDGSGHGVKVITYSDGSQEEVPF